MRNSSSLPASTNRREWLQGTLALSGAAPLCCRTPEAPGGSVTYRGSTLIIDLTAATGLLEPDGARAVVDTGRGINLMVVHRGGGVYAALDRSCTHGGAQCAYDVKRKTLRCTSLNHAEFELDGTLLHGRTHGNLRSYRVQLAGNRLEIALENS